MSMIANIMRDSRKSAVLLSQEEIEDVVDVVDELEPEANEIDDQFGEVEAAEEAAVTLEALADLILGLPGLSQESYVQSMAVVTGITRTAALPVDSFELSTEDAEGVTPEERKTTFADKAKATAGKIKDAAIEGIKRLFAMLRDFVMKFFDRIEKLGGAAASRIEALKADGAPEEFSVPKGLIPIVDSVFALKNVNAQLGGKATEAISKLKVGGDNNAAYEALRGITSFKIPKLFANPQIDPSSGSLSFEWPAIDAATKDRVSKGKLVDALQQVVAICDVIKAQRGVLKNSALSANEASLSRVFGAEESAKQFGSALKLINGVYKSWVSYVGRVCNEVVKMTSPSNAKQTEEKA